MPTSSNADKLLTMMERLLGEALAVCGDAKATGDHRTRLAAITPPANLNRTLLEVAGN